MSKMKRKADLLKSLIDDMMGGEREESMERLHGLRSSESDSKHESMEAPMKATIMAKDEAGLIEGAKKLPEILSKAEAYKKLRMSEKKKKK